MPKYIEKVVAGTGHRPNKLGGYGKEIKDKLNRLAIVALEEQQPSFVVSGMALGWDTALAFAARELQLPLCAAVPFRGQESRWPLQARKEYQGLLEYATDVVICSDGGYSPEKMKIRNRAMTDAADVLLALWDGSHNSGTGHCVQYAISLNKPVINFYKRFLNGDGRPPSTYL